MTAAPNRQYPMSLHAFVAGGSSQPRGCGAVTGMGREADFEKEPRYG